MNEQIRQFLWRLETGPWKYEILVVAPSLQQAIRIAEPYREQAIKNHPNDEKLASKKIMWKIIKCEGEVSAIWSLPKVLPKSPTEEQIANAEIEQLLDS